MVTDEQIYLGIWYPKKLLNYAKNIFEAEVIFPTLSRQSITTPFILD